MHDPASDPTPSPALRTAVVRRMFWAELRHLLRWTLAPKLGIPRELLAIVDLLAASPELTAALRDPGVSRMLGDARNRNEFAQLLLVVARLPETAPTAPPEPDPDSLVH